MAYLLKDKQWINESGCKHNNVTIKMDSKTPYQQHPDLSDYC